MEIREAIYKRRSVRSFKDTEVDEAIIIFKILLSWYTRIYSL